MKAAVRHLQASVHQSNWVLVAVASDRLVPQDDSLGKNAAASRKKSSSFVTRASCRLSASISWSRATPAPTNDLLPCTSSSRCHRNNRFKPMPKSWVIWLTRSGLFPWHPGATTDFRATQPVIAGASSGTQQLIQADLASQGGLIRALGDTTTMAGTPGMLCQETVSCETQQYEGIIFIKVVAMSYEVAVEFYVTQVRAFAQQILTAV